MREWYAYGDSQFAKLAVEIHSEFARSRLMDFDEINAPKSMIQKTEKRVALLFRKLKKKHDDWFWDLLLYCYLVALEEAGGTKYENTQSIPPSEKDKLHRLLVVFLEGYDPVTKVVYEKEIERLESRFFETLIADKESGRRGEVDKDYNAYERKWLKYTRQLFIEIEDAVTLYAYEEAGVEKVRWRSMEDSRVCKTCDDLDGQIFKITEVPPKPHLNCRCVLEPV